MPDISLDPTRRRTREDDASCDATPVATPKKRDADDALDDLVHCSPAEAMCFAEPRKKLASFPEPLATQARKSERSAPPAPLPVAPNAAHGVTIAYLAEDLPFVSRSSAAHRETAGAYRLEPMLTKDASGREGLAYYNAFNTETKRVEFVVGPDSLEAFKSQTDWFASAGALSFANGGPKTSWELESARVMNSVMRDGLRAGMTHFARAWNEAVRDPVFWGRLVTNVLTAPAVLDTADLSALVEPASQIDATVSTFKAKIPGFGARIAEDVEPLAGTSKEAVREDLLRMNVPAEHVDSTLQGFGEGARTEVLEKNTEVLRYTGPDAKAGGRWFTEEPVGSPVRDLALDGEANPATHLRRYYLPKGTEVVRSPVAPLNGMPGGAKQIFVSDAAAARPSPTSVLPDGLYPAIAMLHPQGDDQ